MLNRCGFNIQMSTEQLKTRDRNLYSYRPRRDLRPILTKWVSVLFVGMWPKAH